MQAWAAPESSPPLSTPLRASPAPPPGDELARDPNLAVALYAKSFGTTAGLSIHEREGVQMAPAQPLRRPNNTTTNAIAARATHLFHKLRNDTSVYALHADDDELERMAEVAVGAPDEHGEYDPGFDKASWR